VLTILKEKLGLSRNSLLKTGDISKRKTMRKQQFEERKKDHVSHFILQLAFCQSVDLRAWFSKLETELFRIRLSEEDSESIHQLIEQADFGITLLCLTDVIGGQVMNVATYKPPPGKEAKDFHAALLLDLQRLYNLSEQEISKQSFFKVPFETVMDQVRNRQVIVKRGFAYVPRTLQTVLLVNMFKERLEESLEALVHYSYSYSRLKRYQESKKMNTLLQSSSPSQNNI
jgi:DNA primase large subunit